jgi:hypothetical protein
MVDSFEERLSQAIQQSEGDRTAAAAQRDEDRAKAEQARPAVEEFFRSTVIPAFRRIEAGLKKQGRYVEFTGAPEIYDYNMTVMKPDKGGRTAGSEMGFTVEVEVKGDTVRPYYGQTLPYRRNVDFKKPLSEITQEDITEAFLKMYQRELADRAKEGL